MKTIAIFHPSSDLYGSDRILTNALEALPKHIRKKVYLKSSGPLIDFMYNRVENIDIEVCPQMPVIYRKIFTFKGVFQFIFSWFQFIFFLRKENKAHQFQAAYVNTLSNSFILPILVLLRIKAFIHVHEIVVRPRLIGKLTAFVSGIFASNILCVSQAVANNLKGYYKKSAKKMVVLHNGIYGIETTQPEQSKPLSFYLFGRIMPQKGQWLLVEALAKLPRKKLEGTKFTLMGGVLYNQTGVLEDLQQKINEANLGSFVEFKDFAPNISEAMSQADVCLVPSTILDSFPTTVLEAMSAEKMVIATNQGGAKEAILDHHSGLLFEHNCANDLAKKIESVLDHPELTGLFGKAARAHFQSNFTMKIFKDNWCRFVAQNQYI